MSRTLTLAFVEPTLDDHWINRLTARASTHPLCHVELYFDSVNKCFSIISGEKACMRQKTLSNPNYKLLTIAVSEKEYNTSMQYCITAQSWNLDFDEQGMWQSWFCLPCYCFHGRPSEGIGKTFCSKIITEALQFAEVKEVQDANPSTMTPSRLYTLIQGSSRIVCDTVPYKAALLNPERGSIRF